MTAQNLTRCFGQLASQHTMRTVGSTVCARAIPLSRPCAPFRPSTQFSRGLLTRSSLRSSLAVKAEEPGTSEHNLSGSTPVAAQQSDLDELKPVSAVQSDSGVEVSSEAVPTEATQQPGLDKQQPFPGVQSDSVVEVISEAIPTEAVLSASVTDTNFSQSETSTSPVTTPGDWESTFQSFIDVMDTHFEGNIPQANSFSISILKRGVLNFARSRQDILFSLPADKIQAVLAAGPPYKERKVYHLFQAQGLDLLQCMTDIWVFSMFQRRECYPCDVHVLPSCRRAAVSYSVYMLCTPHISQFMTCMLSQPHCAEQAVHALCAVNDSHQEAVHNLW